jgi:uncharacterized protein
MITRLAMIAFAMAGLACAAAPSSGVQQGGASAEASAANPASYTRHLLWEELIPKDWDVVKEVRRRLKDQNIAVVNDFDPRALAMMREIREVLDNAPTNLEMNGVSGRLAGYVVPLETSAQGMKEFLLVPYFGACIHAPPPPVNQIVHVFSAKPAKGVHAMDMVWVVGTLKTERTDSNMGISAYRIDALAVEHYVPPTTTTVK